MLASDEKNLTKTLASEMARFRYHLIDLERHTKNRVITRETAISTIVDALIGQIKRCEEPHRPAKILQREHPRHLRHRFEHLIGPKSDFLRARLSKLPTNDIGIISCACERSQMSEQKKRRRSEHPNAAFGKCGCRSLRRRN